MVSSWRFSVKRYRKLCSIDKLALRGLGYNLADEDLINDISVDVERMKGIMQTNDDIKEMQNKRAHNKNDII